MDDWGRLLVCWQENAGACQLMFAGLGSHGGVQVIRTREMGLREYQDLIAWLHDLDLSDMIDNNAPPQATTEYTDAVQMRLSDSEEYGYKAFGGSHHDPRHGQVALRMLQYAPSFSA